MPECSDIIYDLGKVNQIIDLCIDRELYGYVEKILCIGRKASLYIKTLPEATLEEFDFSKIPFPVLKITTPSDTETTNFFQSPKLFKLGKPSFDLKKKGKDCPPLKHWSDLFWAKRVRAELQKHNRGKWLDRYEDITLFLESRMPMLACKPMEATEEDFYTTKFNYLMELSAVAQGEASFGYAERAREVLNKLYEDYDDSRRGPYNLWVLWNQGTAYQHIGLNHKAILRFNWVIKDFWLQKPEKNKGEIEKILREGCGHKRNVDIVLEYLINIVPAYLQRAAINLKLQLGYHALQTLDGLEDYLEEISQKCPHKLIHESIEHLKIRIILYRIEAFLQLESLKDAKDNIRQLRKIYKNIFQNSWSSKNILLPHVEDKDQYSPKAIETQLIEHVIRLMHQQSAQITINSRDLINKISKNKKDSADKFKATCQSYIQLDKLIRIFPEYWKWVKGNKEDERIYYSRWAQLLKLGMEAVEELRELKNKLPAELVNFLKPKNAPTKLLENTIRLYSLHSKKLPNVRKNHKSNAIIKLDNFRSDDLPDFTGGLSVFYKKMRDILSANKDDLSNLRAVAERTLKNPRHGDPISYLRRHHEDLLDALDEYHEQFGENQQIHALKRCDERLIWARLNGKDDPRKGCKNCLGGKKSAFSPESFDGLLLCQTFQKEIPSDKKELPPEKRNMDHNDYEFIMQDTEKHLTEHLAWHSQQPPQQTLRFIGLQRWNSLDRKSTRLNSSHTDISRMPSSA